MRKKLSDKELFDESYNMIMFPIDPKNLVLRELQSIDKLLDEIPQVLEYVHADLNRCPRQKGCPARISSEQVLRSAILMDLRQLDYRHLQSEIDMNPIYRWFTRFYERKIPHYTHLNDLIKQISPETMNRINEELLQLGIKKKAEDGKALRLDTTVAQTDIAYPTDARLLNDSVRVLDRTLRRLREDAPDLRFCCKSHVRRAKKRAYQIVMAKGRNAEKTRKKCYQVLLETQLKVCGYVQSALDAVKVVGALAISLEVMSHVAELERYLALSRQVYDQAYRRVILGENVPADEKLVSIFETHTDIICRGKKDSPTEFGHKINFAVGRSGMVLGYDVLEGNPGDNELLLPSLGRHIETFGHAPDKLTADRRYFSAENEKQAMELVKQVALPKSGVLSEARKEFQKQPWFKRLLRWRAGVEGCLSTLLRVFGIKRCQWKGWRSFKAYIGLGVLTYNLRVLSAHLAQA